MSVGAGGVLGTTRNRTDLFLKYRNQARGINRFGADAGPDASRCANAGLTAKARMQHALLGHFHVGAPQPAPLCSNLLPARSTSKSGQRFCTARRSKRVYRIGCVLMMERCSAGMSETSC